jgi:hypothetical protein
MQAEQLTTNLTRSGVRTDEFAFSAAGANRQARSLFGTLRDRSLNLPDDPETRAEFVATRMVGTGSSTVKIQNPPGAHDDIVTAVGMVVSDLTGRPDYGRGMITNAAGPWLATRTTQYGRPTLPKRLAVRQAARRGPRGLPGGCIVGVARGVRRRASLPLMHALLDVSGSASPRSPTSRPDLGCDWERDLRARAETSNAC